MELVRYEIDGRVATITLARPEARNAQSFQLLEELNDAWTTAGRDEEVRVIVVQADGLDFSAGHDLKESRAERLPWVDGRGINDQYLWEQEVYFGHTQRWRNIPKPSIAAVQGSCIAAGLMLAWPCDLIIAADNARFSDPVIRMGVGAGVEYHGHTWEFGARKAKELLFTAGFIGAEEAHQLGMVNRVVPLDELRGAVLTLAREIAEMDPFALAMAKRAVNTTLDVMGQQAAMQACFDIHWMGHAHVYALSGGVGRRITELDELTAANAKARAR